MAKQYRKKPLHPGEILRDQFMAEFGGRMCEPGFRYSSGENTDWLSVEDIRRLIREHVDPTFTV